MIKELLTLSLAPSLVAFLVIIGVAAGIAIIAFVIYKILNPRLREEKPSDEEILNEEMTRVLTPIDDAETAKQISEYKNEEDE